MKKQLFDKNWFEEKQSILLWFLNFFFTRKLFRYILRINSKEEITNITPNSYSWGDKLIFNGKWNLERTTDFRTHNKYSKRLFYALKPLWYLFHYWDILIANNFNFNWNLGFDTVGTFYPDAGTGNTSVDGHCRHFTGSPITWANLIIGAGFDADDTNVTMFIQMTASAADDWVSMFRMLFTFDTSNITSEATISVATLSLYGSSKIDELSATPDINIYASAPADDNALVAGDYNSLGSTPFSSVITYANFNTSAYNDFVLNANGLAAIDKVGISKFGARNANYDVAEIEPNWISSKLSQLIAIAADTAGTSTDPKLVVTYTTAFVVSINDTINLSENVIKGLRVTLQDTINVNGEIAPILGNYDKQAKPTGTYTKQDKT